MSTEYLAVTAEDPQLEYQPETEVEWVDATETSTEPQNALPGAYRAIWGDTYVSIAEKYPKSGLTNYERAKELAKLNNYQVITGGKAIKL